jgi:hypothetical protein
MSTGDLLSGRLETQHKTLHTLEQGVMQFTGDSLALGMSLLKAVTQMLG